MCLYWCSHLIAQHYMGAASRIIHGWSLVDRFYYSCSNVVATPSRTSPSGQWPKRHHGGTCIHSICLEEPVQDSPAGQASVGYCFIPRRMVSFVRRHRNHVIDCYSIRQDPTPHETMGARYDQCHFNPCRGIRCVRMVVDIATFQSPSPSDHSCLHRAVRTHSPLRLIGISSICQKLGRIWTPATMGDVSPGCCLRRCPWGSERLLSFPIRRTHPPRIRGSFLCTLRNYRQRLQCLWTDDCGSNY